MIYSLTALGNNVIVTFDYTCDKIIKKYDIITILDKSTNKENKYTVIKVKPKLSSQELESKRYSAENNKWSRRKKRWDNFKKL